MEKIAYIVGVDHRIQWDRSSNPAWLSTLKGFEHYIKAEIQKLNIDLLAEEFSRQSVKMNRCKGEKSILEEIAERTKIKHLFCDPDSEERKSLGIPSEGKEKEEMREMEWLKRLENNAHERILFVCGNDHVESFKEKLIGKGCQVEILKTGFGKGWEIM